jgi:hypothetical protein
LVIVPFEIKVWFLIWCKSYDSFTIIIEEAKISEFALQVATAFG